MKEDGISQVPTSGGGNLELLNRMAELENSVSQLYERVSRTEQSRATPDTYGLAKVTESTTVTESDSGLVLGAKEKNPAFAGGLANQIVTVNQNSMVEIEWDFSSNGLHSIGDAGTNAKRTGNIVFISLRRYNGVNSINTNQQILVGRIRNEKNFPVFASSHFPITGVQIGSALGDCVGFGCVLNSGDIYIYLSKSAAWEIGFSVAYIAQ